MIPYQDFIDSLVDSPLATWAPKIQSGVDQQLRISRYADLKKWLAALQALPVVTPSIIDCNADAITIGQARDMSAQDHWVMLEQLRHLHPWRKGPYDLFGTLLDTEWRSDWKWQRLQDSIEDLSGRNVLDVGCGNGYHCWRMYGAGAKWVVGVDPSPLFVVQFHALKHFLGQHPVFVLPFTLDTMPEKLPVFDSVFSMGVLYHRRSPFEHLLDLRACLRQGGQLIMETLVIDGDENTVLVPRSRYAKMPNVWFIPSVFTLAGWLERCGFVDIRCVDVTQTTSDEQRRTAWMQYESLTDFLDPHNSALTVEGYPAPKRAIFVARNPSVR